MRTLFALTAAALIGSVAMAQNDKQPEKPVTPPPVQPIKPVTPAGQPTPPSGQPTPAIATPVAPPAAKPPVPVPDLPIVKKQELEGGLILEDMKIGDGYEVKPGGAVVAYYHGTLKADGKEFDSSFSRGEPTAFPLAGVIEGWQKGVPG